MRRLCVNAQRRKGHHDPVPTRQHFWSCRTVIRCHAVVYGANDKGQHKFKQEGHHEDKGIAMHSRLGR